MTLHALKVRGPFRGPSGYDHHVREFVRELVRQGIAVELADLPAWGPARLPPSQRDPWFESLHRPTGAQVLLHCCMPHQVVPEPGRVNVNFTMFEATRVCADWIARNRRHDLLILPTESSRQAWLASGMPPGHLQLCPLGVNPRLFGRAAEPLPLQDAAGQPLARYRVRFLNVSELGPRKNLLGLVRAWLRATRPEDDAVLILKLGGYAPGWRELFAWQITHLEQELGRSRADAAPIYTLDHLFSDEQMPRLFAAASHYISLSHGEGWDQAMVEAAASGLRLIAPDHSAYRAYLDPSVAWLIPAREVPVEFYGDPATAALFAGANWWQPDENAAVAAIRLAIDHPERLPDPPRQRVLTQLTWEAATRRLIEILSAVQPRRHGAWGRLLTLFDRA